MAPCRTVEEVKWAPLPGYVGVYEVSDTGVVRSLSRTYSGRRLPRRKPLRMRSHIDAGGYERVTLSRVGKRSNSPGGRHKLGVHRLVALAHIDPFPDPERVVAHLDGDRLNNHASNLKWVTPRENELHKIGHGTNPGTDVDTCIEVQRALLSGDSRAAIAARFGISRGTVGAIATQRTVNAREAAWVTGAEVGVPLPLIPGMRFAFEG